MDEYQKIRKQVYNHRGKVSSSRRITLGPYASITFQNYDIIWSQIQEMLFIEKGGKEQIKDEISAYNPLLPNGSNLVCVLMFQIENKQKRMQVLYELGWVEKTFWIQFEDEKIMARGIDDDQERTTKDGKTSAVHFLSFDFNSLQAEKFKKSERVSFGSDFPNYSFSSTIPSSTLLLLKEDLD